MFQNRNVAIEWLTVLLLYGINSLANTVDIKSIASVFNLKDFTKLIPTTLFAYFNENQYKPFIYAKCTLRVIRIVIIKMTKTKSVINAQRRNIFLLCD